MISLNGEPMAVAVAVQARTDGVAHLDGLYHVKGDMHDLRRAPIPQSLTYRL